MEEYQVAVYIYDVTKGLARSLSAMILGRQIEGVWHTGVVAYGREFTFGGQGIMSNPPGSTLLGNPDSIFQAGKTEIPEEMFNAFLEELSYTRFRPECYNLFSWNCNTFSNEVVNFLTGKSIPSYIIDLPNEVLNSPGGGALRNLMESMMGSGGPEVGGHSMFPGGNSGNNSSNVAASASNTSAASSASKTDTTKPASKTATSTATAKDSAATGNRSTAASANISATAAVAVEASRQKNDLELPTLTLYEDKEIVKEFKKQRSDVEKSLLSVSSISSTNRLSLLDEVVEYLDVIGSSTESKSCDWALGPMHIQALVDTLLEDKYTDTTRQLAGRLLELTTLIDDIVTLCVHDRAQSLCKAMRAYESLDVPLLVLLLRSLNNVLRVTAATEWFLSLTVKGSAGLTSKTEAVGTEIRSPLLVPLLCTHCLLHDDKTVGEMAVSVTARVVSSEKIGAEVCVDIGIALVELCQRSLDSSTEGEMRKTTAAQLWYSLAQCCLMSEEVIAVIEAMSLDIEMASKKYPHISHYTTRLLKLIDSP